MLDNTTASSPSIFSSISCCKIHVVNGVPRAPRARRDGSRRRPRRRLARAARRGGLLRRDDRASAGGGGGRHRVRSLPIIAFARARSSVTVRSRHRPPSRDAPSHPSAGVIAPSIASRGAPVPRPGPALARASRAARHRASSRVIARRRSRAPVRGVRTRVAIARRYPSATRDRRDRGDPRSRANARSTREVRSTRDRPRREVRRAIERSIASIGPRPRAAAPRETGDAMKAARSKAELKQLKTKRKRAKDKKKRRAARAASDAATAMAIDGALATTGGGRRRGRGRRRRRARDARRRRRRRRRGAGRMKQSAITARKRELRERIAELKSKRGKIGKKNFGKSARAETLDSRRLRGWTRERASVCASTANAGGAD